MTELVKPVFPKSIEEHDKEVNDTWKEENKSKTENNSKEKCSNEKKGAEWTTD